MNPRNVREVEDVVDETVNRVRALWLAYLHVIIDVGTTFQHAWLPACYEGCCRVRRWSRARVRGVTELNWQEKTFAS